MDRLEQIYSLLPDNTSREISEGDLRESFSMTFEEIKEVAKNYYKKVADPGDGKTYLLKIDGSAVDASNFGKVDKVMNIAPDANKNVDISGVAMTWTNQHRFSNISDKKADLTYNRIGGFDNSGNMAVVGFPAIKDTFASFSQAQALEIGQIINGGSGSAGAMSVNLISPPIVQKIDSNEYILLRGVNLNLSATMKKIEIINATTKAIVDTIPDNQIQLNVDGLSLIFYYNFKNFAFGNYLIRLTSGIKVYETTLELKCVENVHNINVNSLVWDKVVNPTANISQDNVAVGSSFVLASESGVGTTIPILSYKSSELFAQGEDFYLEIKLTMPVKSGVPVEDVSRMKVGIGYSETPNALVSKNIIYSSMFLFSLLGIGYTNNSETVYRNTGPSTFSVIFIKTGNLFRTIIGSNNQAITLSNNSGYCIFLELDQLQVKYNIQGQIVKAFTFN